MTIVNNLKTAYPPEEARFVYLFNHTPPEGDGLGDKERRNLNNGIYKLRAHTDEGTNELARQVPIVLECSDVDI